MKFLSTAAVFLACIVIPIRQATASTRHQRIVGDPRNRGQPQEPLEDLPPLSEKEVEEAKEAIYNHILDTTAHPMDPVLKESALGLKRTVSEDEITAIHMSIIFLNNALERTPDVPAEEDDPDFPPAAERYAARAKLVAYKRGELGPVPLEERQVFENDARYTPAEKASAIEIRDTKLALYRTLFAALKKHESGEETLSDEVFADYTKQMDELKAAQKVRPVAEPKRTSGAPPIPPRGGNRNDSKDEL
mmetsp:Transcript_142/g.213  ORF Transcript_142/g.213 Transcript_142/m.213 type:complete len:248 (-) Transcript_142:324-1067(-)